MRFAAVNLDLLKLELEREFDRLANPQGPTKLYSCATADMPPAGDCVGCVLRNTTLNILAVSDGTSWIRQDTGAAI